MPNATPQFSVVCLWSPSLGAAVFFTMPGFNFGLSAAVPQFNRLPECFTHVARSLLGVVCNHFFDDYCTTEPCWSVTSGQRVLADLHSLVGYPFSAKKHIAAAPQVLFLGVESDLRPLDTLGVVIMCVSQKRRDRLCAQIDKVLRGRELSSAAAAHMTGKLGFTLMWAFGRLGRAAMQPLQRRAADSDGWRDDSLSPSVVSALNYFSSLLPVLSPHTFQVDPPPDPPTLVWSDGRFDMDLEGEVILQGTAGVGYVVATPKEGVTRASAELKEALVQGYPSSLARAKERLATLYDFVHGSAGVSEEFMEGFAVRRQYIGQVELLGAFAPYLSVPSLLRGRRVIHWIDNTSAISALAKGYSGVPDSVRLVHAFHACTVALGVTLWFEYVPTKANVSDAPSREDLRGRFYDFAFSELPSLGSVDAGLELPSVRRWDDEAASWWRLGERS